MKLAVDSKRLPKGWEIKTLDDLCEIARGGSPRPIKQFLTDDPNGVNWIKIADASASSKYIYETQEKIKPSGIKRSRLVQVGDFLLSNSMSFGRPYIMRTSGCIHDGWLVLKDKSGLFDQDYLYYFLGSKDTYKQFDRLASGSTVRNLNIDLVKRVKVTLPPIAEQKRVVAILDEAFEGIDTAIANTEKNLANARELFESYLNAVFVQNENLPVVTIGDVGKVFDGPHATPKTIDSGPIFLGISSLQDGKIKLEKTRHVSPEDYKKWTRRVEPCAEDIVFSYETCLGQAAIIPKGLECCLGRRMGLVRFDQSKVEPLYFLYLYLSPPYRKFLDEKTVRGATVDRISIKEFPSFPVPLPSMDEQRDIVAKVESLALPA